MLLTRRAALGVLGATALVGCSPKRSLDTLRIAFCPPTLAPMYQAIANAFMDRHPGLRIELLPAASYGDLMQRDFRLALIEDEPDVSHIGLDHMRFYVERGLALPLDDLVAREPKASLTAHPAIGRLNGKAHALPFAVSVPVSYFNPPLLQKAGVDPEAMVDADWSSLIEMAQRVGRLKQCAGLYFDYAIESAFSWQILVLGEGGRMMSADEQNIAFASPPGLTSARLLRAIGAAGQPDYSRENARVAFSAGQLGCYQNTSANVSRFRDNASGFTPLYAPIPLRPDVGRLPAAGNAAAIVTRNPARHARAWDYIRFACGPVGQTIMAERSGYLSLNETAQREALGLTPLLTDPATRRLYGVLPKLEAWYAFPGPRSEQVSDLIRDMMRELLLGRVNPEAALAAMAAGARKLLRPT